MYILTQLCRKHVKFVDSEGCGTDRGSWIPWLRAQMPRAIYSLAEMRNDMVVAGLGEDEEDF